ncbi:hypothetical protein IQ279_16170 [Streptomyces verrucosisporus]|uniref:hypothetical protein n=1 Tax=Streptomyces verrucosisporus TaxID=1695161 RepID=UPI0019D151FF|nr:hypothetical protein [Streptomyces verrucosisporus]MBN3931147.1 hypothetical protein [Streptomyces verrucosisporus]
MKTITRHDRRMLRLMNAPRHRRLHATRARRRGLVAAHVTLTAAALAVLAPVTAPSADAGPGGARSPLSSC